MMIIDCRPHEGPCDKKGFGSINSSFFKGNGSFRQTGVPDEPVSIDGPIWSTCVMRIAQEVIHPVHIQFPVNNSRKGVVSRKKSNNLFLKYPVAFEAFG